MRAARPPSAASPHRSRTHRPARVLLAIAAIALAGLLPGCVFRTVREQQARADAFAVLAGTIDAEHDPRHPLVVVLIRRDGGATSIADHFVLERPGRWLFRATPGTYALAGFVDRDHDLRYDPDEPALHPDDADFRAVAAGERRTDVALVVPAAGRAPVRAAVDIAAVQARTAPDQVRATLGALTVLGELAALDDARFDPELGGKSLWAPMDFLFDVGAGIYFAEPYDPGRIPVLFVHGITGTPRNFVRLAERLDRMRYQPWFFYYPSGAALDAVAEYLSSLVTTLHVRHGFAELHVVAHSMGGLVARAFLLHHAEAGNDYVTRFVSIATPWSGHDAARRGVERAPAVVRSWTGIATDSPFLSRLFYDGTGARRRLPARVRYALVFAHRRASGRRGPSDDGVVTVASQLRAEAQDEASTIRGFDEAHAAILDTADTAAHVNAALR